MMPRYQRLFALCLALFWVPATAHCSIEALGLDFASCVDACHEPTPGDAHNDGCNIVESGFYKAGANTLKIVPVVAVLRACLVGLHLHEPDGEGGPGMVPDQRGRPREWVPTWQFVQRAALLARAPSSA